MGRKFLIAMVFGGGVLTSPLPVAADASAGEFMGYKLNNHYPMKSDTQFSPSLSGNLLIVADQPVMPADMEEVRVTATVTSHTIGFIEAAREFTSEDEARGFAKKYFNLLRAKYPDWSVDAERIQLNEQTLRPTALNMDKWPYTIRMKLAPAETAERASYRVTLTLRYLFDTPERQAWDELARTEQSEAQQYGRGRKLEDADTRGL
ncbi:MAG: hypothetical protein ACR2QV_16190 [Gammaproteobacteria bacterium]